MVDLAADAGAWAIKIQTFFASDLSDDWKDRFDYYKERELSWDDHKQFVERCNKKNIIPMTSVYTSKYIPKLKDCGFRWIKIGSADNVYPDLFWAYKKAGFRVIVSTGGTNVFDKRIDHWEHADVLMHCVSEYPLDPNHAYLQRMNILKRLYNPFIGYSDHSRGENNIVSKTACLLGAIVIERHFTGLDKSKTKDGHVSVDYDQLRDLCEFDSRLKFTDDHELDAIPYSLILGEQRREEVELIEKYRTRWKRA